MLFCLKGWVGIGASVTQQIRIGAVVGAGADVVHNLPDGVTAVSVAARILSPS